MIPPLRHIEQAVAEVAQSTVAVRVAVRTVLVAMPVAALLLVVDWEPYNSLFN